jgi:hypothetical protein
VPHYTLGMRRWRVLRTSNATVTTLAALLLALAVAGHAPAQDAARVNDDAPPPPDPFLPVFIDDKTEAALGPFPYDRAVYARAIDRAAELGARGVVVKFFLDQPKSDAGDRALADAMRRTKVVLQARLDDAEAAPNPLPARFRWPVPAGDPGLPLSGRRGWIPLPAFAAVAHDVGFIDHRVIDRMPLVERYGDTYVKSLYLCCLELARDQAAVVEAGKSIRLGDATVALDARSEVPVEYPAADDLAPVSFVDFLAPAPRPEVKGRVVILAYDATRFEPVNTPRGKMRPHRVFYYALRSIERRFR